MNEFLNKIYNSPYFVIGLFILILILAIVFILLVFSGKKKKNKNGKDNKLEENLQTINNATANETTVPTDSVNNGVAPTAPSIDALQPRENKPIGDNVNNTPVDIPASPINETPVVEASPVIENNNPIDITSNPVDIASSPIDTPAKTEVENNNNDLFNTSIFHGMPEELGNINNATATVSAATPSVSTEPSQPVDLQNTFTNNIFEPVPDLSKVDVPVVNDEEVKPVVEPDIPIQDKVVEEPAVEVAIPNNNIPTPELGDYQKERIVQPTQFSSVYINKDEPKEEVKPEVTTANDKPPYDPTLFNTLYNSKPVETPRVNDNVVPKTIETPEVNLPNINLPEENKVNEQPKDDFSFDLPKFDPLPPLEPMNSFNQNVEDLEKTNVNININPNNTFEMPSLVPNTPESNPTSNEENGSGLPNFNNETFNIK